MGGEYIDVVRKKKVYVVSMWHHGTGECQQGDWEKDDLCLYPIVVNGNTFWCNQNKYHNGDHTVDGGYFQIQWRSGLNELG